MMTVNDASLLAYVDGELPLFERADIENAMRASAYTAMCVSMLRASQLPYAAAFSHQALPPVPHTLTQQVDQLVHLHLWSGHACRENGDDDALRHDAEIPMTVTASVQMTADNIHAPPLRWGSRMRMPLRQFAAAFVAGALCLGVALWLTPQFVSGTLAFATAPGSPVSPWIAAAANYQALYTRDTVAQVQTDRAAAAATVEEIRHADDLPLQIPDLRNVGLAFRRVERLRFHDKPLAQIVYLPVKGRPIALCVLKEAKADAPPASVHVDDMDVVSWRRGKLGYALIGEHGNVDLFELGKQIYSGAISTTIGRNKTEIDIPRG
jgi:anti-sigma factor RsiW